MLELEKLVVRLVMDASQMMKSVANVQQRMMSAGKKLQSWGTKLTLALTLPLAGIGAVATKAYGDFNQAMVESTAIMGEVSAKTRAEMEKTARTLSREGVKSAEELARSYYFLASAGLNAEQSMTALPKVMRFSQAGAFDMATATDLLTDAQTALGIEVDSAGENMQKLGDHIVLAARQANASVQQFSESVTADAGVAARNFGMDIETLMAVLGAYASSGKKGAEAGNLLGRATRLLTKAYRENGEVFAEYGIEVVDEATGEYRNFIDIIGDLENALGRLPAPARAAALAQMGFEALSQKALLPLIGMTDQMKEWEEAQKSAAGTTERVATKQLAAFNNQVKRTKNIVMDAAITIGELLAPSILKMNDRIEDAVNLFRDLDQSTQMMIVNAGKFAAVIGPLLTASGLLLRVWAPLLPIFLAAGKALLSLGVTIGSVVLIPLLKVVAIASLVVGAITGILYVLVGPEGLAAGWTWVKEKAEAAWKTIRMFIGNFGQNMRILAAWFLDNWRSIFSDIGQATIVFFKNMGQNAWVAIRIWFRLFNAFNGWLVGILADTFQAIFSAETMQKINKGIRWLWDAFKVGFKAIGAIAAGIGVAIYEALKIGFQNSIELLTSFGKIFKKAWSMILKGQLPDPRELLKDFTQAMGEQILKAGQQAADKFEEYAGPIAKKMSKAMKATANQAAKDFGSGLASRDFVSTANRIIKEESSDFVNPLAGFEPSTTMPELILKGYEGKSAKDAMAGFHEAMSGPNGPMQDAVDLNGQMVQINENLDAMDGRRIMMDFEVNTGTAEEQMEAMMFLQRTLAGSGPKQIQAQAASALATISSAGDQAAVKAVTAFNASSPSSNSGMQGAQTDSIVDPLVNRLDQLIDLEEAQEEAGVLRVQEARLE